MLITLLIPQVALAAWWNPFSWAVFHRTGTKTQILENRVKELEQKLGNIATSSKPTIKKADVAPTLKPTIKSVENTEITSQASPGSYKSIQNNNAQTYEYKKVLIISKLAPGVARLKTMDGFTENILNIVSIRVHELNALISTNESLANNLTWVDLRQYIYDVNESIRSHIKYLESVSNSLIAIKTESKLWLNALSGEATRISQLNSISKIDFDKESDALDVANKNINDANSRLEKIVSDSQVSVDSWTEKIKKMLDEQQRAINYLSSSYSNSQSTQYNFTTISREPFPIIVPPQIRTTNCNINVNPVGNSGTINCFSY